MGATLGLIDLELERHLVEFRAGAASVDPSDILALKKGSALQFAELKHRLADNVADAQRAGEQLQRCAHFFNSHEKRGFRREDSGNNTMWIELGGLCLLIAFILPIGLREAALSMLGVALASLHTCISPFIDPRWLADIGSGMMYAVALNIIIVVMFAVIIWKGMKA